MKHRGDQGPYAVVRATYWRHPRVTPCSMGATGLDHRAKSMSADHMSDGYIPDALLGALFCGRRVEKALINELLRAELWVRVDGGYQIRNWEKHNPTSEEIRKDRELERKRKEEWRVKRSAFVPDNVPWDKTGTTKSVPWDKTGTSAAKIKNKIKIRLEEDKILNVTPPAHTSQAGDTLTAFESVCDIFSKARLEAGGGPYNRQPTEYRAVCAAAEMFEAEAARSSEPWEELVQRSARGFCRDAWAQSKNWPVSAWLKDPGRWLVEAPKAKQKPDEIILERMNQELRNASKNRDRAELNRISAEINAYIASCA